VYGKKIKFVAAAVLVLGALVSSGGFASTLRINVVDEAGHPIWARLEVRGKGGKMYHPAQSIRDPRPGVRPGVLPFYPGSFVIHGECRLRVPPGNYRIIGMHGAEYERVERSVAVSGGGSAAVTLPLWPWVRMRKLGWWSADFHVHRPPEDVRNLVLAEDLNFCPVITAWPTRRRPVFWQPDIWGPGPAPVIRVDSSHFVTLKNAEDERGGGAWIFQMLREPLAGFGSAERWYPSGLKFVEEAREQRGGDGLFPWFDCEKPFWWEVPVMMALATPDSLEIIPNHVTEYGVEAYEAWGRPRNTREFPGPEGWVDYVLGLYYHYLNLGFHLPATAGGASGVLPNPVGFNRVYAQISGPFTAAKWFSALRKGHSFVTNGPMLFFNVSPEGSLMKATVEARAARPLDRIEVVANGRIIQWFPVPPGRLEYKAEFTFDPAQYSWIAARCFLRPGVTIRMAHTSPVYLKGHYDCRPDAQFFIGWMNDLIRETQADPQRFSSPSQREEILKIYAKALAFYQSKLQQGCRAD